MFVTVTTVRSKNQLMFVKRLTQ